MAGMIVLEKSTIISEDSLKNMERSKMLALIILEKYSIKKITIMARTFLDILIFF